MVMGLVLGSGQVSRHQVGAGKGMRICSHLWQDISISVVVVVCDLGFCVLLILFEIICIFKTITYVELSKKLIVECGKCSFLRFYILNFNICLYL